MRLTILLLLFLSKIAFAQPVSHKERIYSDTLPERFILNYEKIRNHIFAGIPSNIRTGEYSRRAMNFANNNASRVSEYISSGVVYSDWDEMEVYLNSIMKKLLPDELQKDSMIHVYIVRDGDFNAFMTPAGMAFVNIGILSESKDEASIAAILAHELAHYYLRHSLYTFLEAEAGNFNRGIFDNGRPRGIFSVKNETQADSLAAVWIQKSGYNSEGLANAFRTMYRLERNRLKRYSEWTFKETTHPLSIKRLERMNEFINQHKNNLGANFLVDETKFNRLKEEVKPEILKRFLHSFDYSACIETAFKFHLFDPDNSTYIYYIMEGTRRKAYLNVDIWSKMFITNNYYDSTNVNGERHKELMTNHLFKKFDLDIVSIDPKDGMKLKARFYWRDTPKFTTYEEAYNFFYTLSVALKCEECVLSNALSYTEKADSSTRIKMLEKYLAFPSAKHKEYAEAVLNGTITKKLNNQKMTSFDGLNVIVEQGYETISLRDEKDLFTNVVDSTMRNQPNRKAVYLPLFKKTHLNDYTGLMALRDFSMTRTVSKGEKTELHILDPIYWEMFHKYNVNEIEFVFTRYYEVRAKDKSLASYQKVTAMDFNTLFGKTSHTKYFIMFISSVREVENGLMKFRHFNDENTLTSKENTSTQLSNIIRYELGMKEKKMKEADSKYANSRK